VSPIKHVVIIVKENHGYDNYCFDFKQKPLPPPQ